MAFEGLSEKLQNVFKGLKGKGSLTEADINAAMREVKLALLEADVNFKVVKEFVDSVKQKSLGEEVMASLTPGQQVIKIVNEELTELMGGQNARLTYSPQAPTIYMLCGLQGAGKTTMAGKLGNLIKNELMQARNWPMGATLSIAMLLFTFAFILIYKKVTGAKNLGGIR